MKQLFFFLPICILLGVAPLFAQNSTTWFPPGAKWSYSYGSFSGNGEEYLEWVGQEIIGGELCAKMHYYGFEESFAFFPLDKGFRYFFARNDSVFLWNNNAFNLLYDFNRKPGDTFLLPTGNYDFGIVQQAGDTTWNGIPVRFQDISLGVVYPWMPVDTFYKPTLVYERLGGTHLIYWDIESPLTEIQYTLGCYRDDEYPLEDCPLGYDPTYVGFPQFGTSVWSETDGGWCSFRGYQYKVEGDSVISGVGQGKKVYFRNTFVNSFCPGQSNEIIHEPFRLIGLLDQDIQVKKVYFARLTDDSTPFSICTETDSFPLNKYRLLYDFDLDVGDTLSWKPFPNVVKAIDSIQLDNGTWRRTFVFQPSPFNPFDSYYWIEGIGSDRGLFGSFGYPQISDINCRLQCFRHNNQLLYSTVDAVFCDSIAVATHEPNDFNYALRLYPNPSSGKIMLEMPISEIPAMLRIFDPQGRELGRLEVREAESQMDLSAWQHNAILLLQIQGASGQLAARVLRIE